MLLYKLVHTSEHCETQDVRVRYRHMYPSTHTQDKRMWGAQLKLLINHSLSLMLCVCLCV